MLISANELIIERFAQCLSECYGETHGSAEPEYGRTVSWAGRIAAQILANLCDAPYHDLQHTIDVTLVAQEILRGKFMVEPVAPDDWMHVLIACAFHDIGYAKNLLPEDCDRSYPRGATGACLSEEHIERGKLFVSRRFAEHPLIDAERLTGLIEYTRFPIPPTPEYAETGTLRALIRAADLIGQLASLHLREKQWALFQEFQETGTAARLGYDTADDLRDAFPSFFYDSVSPYIGAALAHLERTGSGRRVAASLFANVLRAEHPELRRPCPPHPA